MLYEVEARPVGRGADTCIGRFGGLTGEAEITGRFMGVVPEDVEYCPLEGQTKVSSRIRDKQGQGPNKVCFIDIEFNLFRAKKAGSQQVRKHTQLSYPRAPHE